MRTISQMVSQEVVVCLSSLVARMEELDQDRASDLTSRYEDCRECEGTGYQEGDNDEDCPDCDEGERLIEVYEHWAVTDWLAEKLEDCGEIVDRDFYGLCVWGRQTTGQAIEMDWVIQQIYKETAR